MSPDLETEDGGSHVRRCSDAMEEFRTECSRLCVFASPRELLFIANPEFYILNSAPGFSGPAAPQEFIPGIARNPVQNTVVKCFGAGGRTQFMFG